MDSSPHSSINDLVERRTIEEYDTFRCVLTPTHNTVLPANVSLWWTVLSQSQALRSLPNQCELSSSPDYSTSPEIPQVARKSQLTRWCLSRSEDKSISHLLKSTMLVFVLH